MFGRLLVRGGLVLVRPGSAFWRYGTRHPFRLLGIGVLLAVVVFGVLFVGIQLWAAYHLRAARDCVERYHDNEATLHLHACLWVHPNDPEALLLAARTARRTGVLHLADESLARYEELRGVDDALILERMLLRAERGDIESVRKFLWARVEQQHPDAPLILETLARAFLRSFRERQAEECLNRWQNFQPDNTQALVLRGMLTERHQGRGRATAFYRKAVEIDPYLDDARMRLATALVQLGQGREALPHLEYLRQRLPDRPEVGLRLAQNKDLLGQPAEAVKVLDDVLARYPDFPEALAERGKHALASEHLEEAESLLQRAVSLDPGSYTAHYQLYTCLTRRGKTVEAKEEADQLRAMEADATALNEIIKQIQRTPNDPAVHYQIAQIMRRAGRIDEAVRWLQSALRADPTYAPAHQMLSVYYLHIGNRGLAAYHRTQARSAATKEPPAASRTEPAARNPASEAP